ncbi:MAG TPA: hydrogenase maturation protease [Mycobacteriales bacterium]|nr:hydrogenase maturation protease [Mycobacteriales bacterium]
MSGHSVLVAGVGNIFLGDDGFGVEVVRRLAGRPLPETVKVADFGIRGVHLAYELLDGYDTTILVDAMPHGETPGTVSVLELDPNEVGTESAGDTAVALAPDDGLGAPVLDAHGMTPDQVFGLLRRLGGHPRRVLVVGCEPADITDRMGLSEPVAAAVDAAVEAVFDLANKEAAVAADGTSQEGGTR